MLTRWNRFLTLALAWVLLCAAVPSPGNVGDKHSVVLLSGITMRHLVAGPEGGAPLPDLAYDVLVFMDAMGIDKAAVAGHSMGSFVGQYLAAAYPPRFQQALPAATFKAYAQVGHKLHWEIPTQVAQDLEAFLR